MNKDWTVNEIIMALKEKGISINKLASKARNKQGVVDYEELKQLIADALNIPVDRLWPPRCDD